MTEAQFEEAISLMLKRDRLGLRSVYDAYLSYIYRIMLGVVGRKEDAEDLTSEFFIKLYQTAEKYRPGQGHKAYLATIARNMAIDFLRKNKREVLESFQKDENEDEYLAEPAGKDDTEKEVIEDVSLTEALSKLNDKERIVIDMKILSEMTFKEISDALKLPMGTVTWRYNEAIKKLRRCGYYEKA